ncbi:unnamed protein product [Dibothriocephalus latus]|uniref:Fibronectin type-III domain-containing protein n=1 Tax=Dibothriocephalus latus TaxID=60516 RepID=A0A3P7NUE0_DIBLA|nr:unnamed protein product [Dibothriocephalus latus]
MAPNDDPDAAKDIRTKADSLKLFVTHLQANTKYKFTIRAYVLPDGQGHGGGYSIPSVAGYVTTSVGEESSAEMYNLETDAAESVPTAGL